MNLYHVRHNSQIMKKFIYQTTALLICFGAFQLAAQNGDYSLDTSESTMSVLGTSTLHDWESVVEEVSAQATVKGKSLTNVSLQAVVKSIKSGKAGMDSNTYKALKADDYPEITFVAEKLKASGSSLAGDGQLTVGAVTNDITVDLTYEELSDDAFKVTGEIPMKMTDFGITPPTAMLGAIKTGDDVTIKFEIAMKK